VLDFVTRYVQPLDAYDRDHTADLRHTLQEYFESGRRLAECARRLHIHVATLRYRLDKATQLLEIDLRDPHATLDLQVALRAAQVLDAQRG
jgi:DNA-binding PucR family transcriptional regulator